MLLAYPAWYAVAGPRALPRTVWPDIQFFGSAWRTLFLPAGAHDRGPNAILETYGYFGSHPLLLGYLGLGMAATLVIGLAWFHRDGRLWFCAAMLVLLEVLSLGASVGPWRLFDHLPLVENVVPDRIAGVADLFAAVMLGVILDRARNSGLTWPGRPRPEPVSTPARGRHPGRHPHRHAPARDPGGLGPGRPGPPPHRPRLPAPVHHPTGRRSPVVHHGRDPLPADAVVLTYPFASSGLRAPMTWQAVGSLRYSLVGGGSITPTPPAHPTDRQRAVARATVDLINLSDGFSPLPTGRPDESARLRLALHDWGATTVVVPDESTWPAALRGRSVPVAVATFTTALGTGPRLPGRRLGVGRPPAPPACGGRPRGSRSSAARPTRRQPPTPAGRPPASWPRPTPHVAPLDGSRPDRPDRQGTRVVHARSLEFPR